MIVGVRQLVDTARAAYIIINTTGFVTGPGRVLKVIRSRQSGQT